MIVDCFCLWCVLLIFFLFVVCCLLLFVVVWCCLLLLLVVGCCCCGVGAGGGGVGVDIGHGTLLFPGTLPFDVGRGRRISRLAWLGFIVFEFIYTYIYINIFKALPENMLPQNLMVYHPSTWL